MDKDISAIELDDPRFQNLNIPVEIRRHPAARHLTLRISRTHRAVVVTLPEQCDVSEAGKLVCKHIEWVKERLYRFPEPVPFENGALIPLRNEFHHVSFENRRAKNVPLKILHEKNQPPKIWVSGPISLAPQRLRQWLFQQASQDLKHAVFSYAEKLQVKPRGLIVRDQLSRWGSCSTNGSLAFSWRLIMAPRKVLKYVAAHEVAHLKEMNHGSKFWSLVRVVMPEMNEPKKWLRSYGVSLYRYGGNDEL